jgi:hypothetical protein
MRRLPHCRSGLQRQTLPGVAPVLVVADAILTLCVLPALQMQCTGQNNAWCSGQIAVLRARDAHGSAAERLHQSPLHK